MYKFSANGNTACYVSPLNQSEANPQTVRANMKKVGEVSILSTRYTDLSGPRLTIRDN